jgi:drug/metabolite transporter (DMT)-like permease
MTRSGPSRWLVDSSLILVALIWGSTFVLVKQALADIPTLFFLTLRFSIASVALAVLFRGPIGQKTNVRESVKAGLLAGFCLFSGYVLQTYGLKYTTAAKAGFLTGLYIPLVPLFSAAVYKKIPQIAELLGVGLAFAGMALLTMQGSALGVGLGDFLVMGCAVAYAFHILVLGHFAPKVSTPILTVVQILTAAALGASTFWWAEPASFHWADIRWSKDVFLALAVTSLLATALAFAVQTWAQQYSSPTRTALIFSLEPVFAWATSYLLLGEVLSTRGAAGAVLILAGILIVELKPLGLPRMRTRQQENT